MKIRPEVLVFAFLAISFFLRVFRGTPVDCDFTQFWAMARIPFSQRADPATLVKAENDALAGTGVQPVPYIRPQAFAIPLEPLKFLPLIPAYRLWAFGQFLCLCAFLWLAHRIAPIPWLYVGLVGLYQPAMHAISLGQDVPLMALLLLLGLIALKDDRQILAGLLFAAALFKYQLLWALPIFLLAERRYRALLSLAAAGLVLAAVSCVIMRPTAYLAYATHVADYLPGFSPADASYGLRGLLSPWLYGLVVVAALAIAWRAAGRLDMQFTFCVFLTISVALAFYVMHHDYTLLLLPFFVALHRGPAALKYIAATALLLPAIWFYRPAVMAFLVIFCGALMWHSLSEAGRPA